MSTTETLQRWICESCGYIYDPEEGDPDGGIPPGTAFEDIPDTWFCPVCGRASATYPLRGLGLTGADAHSRATASCSLALDRERVWHPYGALPARAAARCRSSPRRACGCRLADGRELIDGMASWWCAIHGYRHPALDAAVARAAGADGARDVRRAHARAGGAPGRAAGRARAGRAWSASSSPTRARCRSRSRSRCACSSSARAGGRERTRLLTVRGGYHGDTFGAMAVCDPVGGMHSLFAGVLPEHVFAERPPDGFDAGAGRALGGARARSWSPRTRDELAAVIVEPVVQGAGGMRFHSPECVRAAARAVRRARPAARARRDRHRLRAHRRAVRLRARRRRPGRDVRRQGADRRLHDARRDAVHARRSPRPSPRARAAG